VVEEAVGIAEVVMSAERIVAVHLVVGCLEAVVGGSLVVGPRTLRDRDLIRTLRSTASAMLLARPKYLG